MTKEEKQSIDQFILDYLYELAFGKHLDEDWSNIALTFKGNQYVLYADSLNYKKIARNRSINYQYQRENIREETQQGMTLRLDVRTNNVKYNRIIAAVDTRKGTPSVILVRHQPPNEKLSSAAFIQSLRPLSETLAIKGETTTKKVLELRKMESFIGYVINRYEYLLATMGDNHTITTVWSKSELNSLLYGASEPVVENVPMGSRGLYQELRSNPFRPQNATTVRTNISLEATDEW